ncbi:MAG: PQQ-binding-like beta-propeller repeat protein [Rhodospirillales bacterium]
MLRLGLLFAMVLVLGGCESWFGETDKPPLPGKRISVLEHQRTLAPDGRAQTEPIELPPPRVNPEWPQAGGYANHAMHHLQLADTIERAWTADIGSGRSSSRPRLSSPVIADGRIYTMDTRHVVTAFDAQSGQRVWRTDLAADERDDDAIVGGLGYEQGRLIATTGFAQAIALDAATGNELWRRKVGLPFHSAPTVRGGRVFAITVDNTLHALSVFDGSTLWTFGAITETASLLGDASSAVDADVVVAPFSSGELVSLKAENGRVLWSDSLASRRRTDELATIAQIRGLPVIDRGRVFAVGYGGITAAIDLRTGQRNWDRDIGGLQTPWVAGRFVYMVTDQAELVCLSWATGSVHWVAPLDAYGNPDKKRDPILWSGPVLVGDRLVAAGSHGRVLSVSPYDGRPLGELRMPAGVTVPPVVANGMLYILADNGQLVAFR